MKKIFNLCLLLAISSALTAQNIQVATGGKVSFFSETPLENIDATTQSATSVITTGINSIQFTVPMRTFKFKKSLMEEHFNEKYVESEKYPKSTFKGKINEAINWSRDTVADITATGEMSLHGVTKTITEKGKLTIRNGIISLDVTFNIPLKDYNIEIPKVVTQSIAEVVKITGSFAYKPYEKK
jgi:polyisoprenoid-binding protein YceI